FSVLCRCDYRVYDAAGLAFVDTRAALNRARVMGRVQGLADEIERNPLAGQIGIAHTRWATHGAPSERNAHPHFSGDKVALVHNGIIENYEELRAELKDKGYEFSSDTDTEVVAHLIADALDAHDSLFSAVRAVVK